MGKRRDKSGELMGKRERGRNVTRLRKITFEARIWEEDFAEVREERREEREGNVEGIDDRTGCLNTDHGQSCGISEG